MDHHRRIVSNLRVHLIYANLSRSSYERVCSELGVTPAILRKALKSTGTTFRALVDFERRARLGSVFDTVEMSRGATHPPAGTYIYKSLGFCDVDGFYRWHKRIYGVGYGVRVSKFMLEQQRKI